MLIKLSIINPFCKVSIILTTTRDTAVSHSELCLILPLKFNYNCQTLLKRKLLEFIMHKLDSLRVEGNYIA